MSLFLTMAPMRKPPSGRTSILSSGRPLISTSMAGNITLSFIRSMSVVPPATNAALGARTRSIASFSFLAFAYSKGSIAFPLSAFAHGLYRGKNIGISPAAADIAAHAFANIIVTGAAGLFQQCRGGHDLSRCAVSALEGIVFNEGRLHG